MKKLFLLSIILLLLGSVHAFVFMQNNQGDLIIHSGNSTILSFRFYTDELNQSSNRGTFWVSGDQWMITNGFIGYYYTPVTILNTHWVEKRINFSGYEPGSFTIIWGVNLSNSSVYQSNFNISIDGGEMNMSGHGLNDSSFYAPRIKHYGGNTSINNTNLHKNTTAYIEKDLLKKYVLPSPPLSEAKEIITVIPNNTIMNASKNDSVYDRPINIPPGESIPWYKELSIWFFILLGMGFLMGLAYWFVEISER